MRIGYILFAALLVFAGCNSNTPVAEKKKVEKGPVTSKLSAQGTARLISLLTSYYALKNALVATDAAKAKAASGQLAGETWNMAAFLQADSVNKTALQPYLDTIAAQSKTIEGIDDKTCEKQRIAFGVISSAMFGMLKSTDIKNGGVYKQYCPMAFNDKGAYWLSEEEEIKNPYFGKKMLECGEVQDSL